MKIYEKALLDSFSALANVLTGLGSITAYEAFNGSQKATIEMIVADAKAGVKSILEALEAFGECPDEWRCFGVPFTTINTAKLRIEL